MVWPILISAALTPRISAASDTVGSATTASTPNAANPAIKRIATLPSFVALETRERCPAPIGWGPCHGRTIDAKSIDDGSAAEARRLAWRVWGARQEPREATALGSGA